MTPQDPLQALNPLREPSPVGWWPPAPGWWFLAAVTLALLLLLSVWLWRRYRRNAYRREAARQLRDLQSRSTRTSEQLQQVNAVLKRAALAAYPGASVASLGGRQWLDFLQRTLPGNRRPFAGLDGDILYAQDPPPESADAFTDAALTWVRHHRGGTGDA